MIRALGVIVACCLLGSLGEGRVFGDDPNSWPMLAHDATRSGATSFEIRPPFSRKWYRLFPEEGIMAGVQPISARGHVYVATLRGVIHAIDSDSGKDLWTFQSGGSILASPACDDRQVYFTATDGKLYALAQADGQLRWTFATGQAVWNSPLPVAGKVIFGGRDGHVYAVDPTTGKLAWRGDVKAPILSSPAADVGNNRVFFACEDMRVYAFSLSDGHLLWTSERLPGVSFRGYYPVIAPDGSVLVTTTPLYGQDEIQDILLDAVREIFGEWASWRHTREENERLRQANFELLARPETYPRQMEAIRRRLLEHPEFQTFFVLDGTTGARRCVPPIVYAESMNGTGMPPVVAPDGKVIVKYQALLRSRYEHYSPFLNVGYLNCQTGEIVPIMDQSRTYGWHDSLLLVHDEQCALGVAGRILINTHQNDVNALDLATLKGYTEPFCRNIHEPAPHETAAIWRKLLHEEELPIGKEWLAQGTAVYGGGSVIDVAVTVADDGFYYLPTHELNAGCAVIAYRMDKSGTAHRETMLPQTPLTNDEQEQLRSRPWDWDTLRSPRLARLCGPLGNIVPSASEISSAETPPERLTDDQLNHMILQAGEADTISWPNDPSFATFQRILESEVERIIQQAGRPFVFPAGKHPQEAYRFFADPAETLWALALAYPFVGDQEKQRIRGFVEGHQQAGGVFEPPFGKSTWNEKDVKSRSFYDVPKLPRLVLDDRHFDDATRLYVFWLWARRSNQIESLRNHWATIKARMQVDSSAGDVDLGNGRLAGWIAFCQLARHFGDGEALAFGLQRTRQLIRDRLQYEFSHQRLGLMQEAKQQRYVFARWRNLTSEVAAILRECALPIHKELWSIYVQHHRPTWWLAWNVETAWRNENPFALPSMSEEIFAAQALILQRPPHELAPCLDVPWCQGDLFFVRKLAYALSAMAQADVSSRSIHR